MAQDIAKRDINLAQEIYIHYKKENYLDYKKKYLANADSIDWNLISQIYRKDANVLKGNMAQLSSITNKDGETVASALGILKDLTSNEMLSKIEREMITTVPEKVRNGIAQTQQLGASLNKITDVNKQISILDNYISYIKDVITIFNKNNDDYMNYILSRYKKDTTALKNINSLFRTGNGLNLLAINKTALTAFESLKSRVSQLENIKEQLQSGNATGTVDYKGKKVSYSSYIYPMHYLFSDILGGIGEGVGATFALKEINNFLKGLENENTKVTIEGTGTQQIQGSTRKGDYEININSEDGTVTLSFGISAKAQSLNSSKKVTTTFQTSKLGVFINQLNNIEKYLFYNNLYHNTDSGKDGYNYYIRRKIAAQNFLNAVTGLNQGENVLFIQYLNDLIRVDEFFEDIAAATPDNLPGLSISGLKTARTQDYINRRGAKLNALISSDADFQDLNPQDKNVLAFVRSRQVIKNLNNLTTQIQYEH